MKDQVSGKRYPVSTRMTLMPGRARLAMWRRTADSAPKELLMTREEPHCLAAKSTMREGPHERATSLTEVRSNCSGAAMLMVNPTKPIGITIGGRECGVN